MAVDENTSQLLSNKKTSIHVSTSEKYVKFVNALVIVNVEAKRTKCISLN